MATSYGRTVGGAFEKKAMNIRLFLLSMIGYVTIISCQRNDVQDLSLIQTVWNHHRSFGKENDTLYLDIQRTNEKTNYIYYENKQDSIISMLYSIMKNGDLIFFDTDTFELSEATDIILDNDSLKLLRYEYPDPLPGGMGCMVFTEEIGLLGMGVYVGGKKLLVNWNNLQIEKDVILDKMKWRKNNISPPPKIKE